MWGVGLSAFFAYAADEALGHDAFNAACDEEWFDAHVQQACHCAGSVVGVQCGEDEVACERCLDGGFGGFLIANLADHDDVGIVAEDCAEAGCEVQSDFGVDLDLIDAVDVILDGVFYGDGFDFIGDDAVKRCVEGC